MCEAGELLFLLPLLFNIFIELILQLKHCNGGRIGLICIMLFFFFAYASDVTTVAASGLGLQKNIISVYQDYSKKWRFNILY